MSDKQTTCEWKEADEYAWETDCDNLFYLTCDTPQDHGMKFCCYCGLPLTQPKQSGDTP